MQVKEACRTENTGNRADGQEDTADTAEDPTCGVASPYRRDRSWRSGHHARRGCGEGGSALSGATHTHTPARSKSVPPGRSRTGKNNTGRDVEC